MKVPLPAGFFLLAAMVDKTLDISDEDIDKIEKRCNIKLAARQREALEKAAQHGVVVITGDLEREKQLQYGAFWNSSKAMI